MKVIIGVICTLLLANVYKIGYSKGAGRCGGIFLRLDSSARAAGMGSVYTAIADTSEALFYNPAGLAQIEVPSSYFMHTEYLHKLDIYSEYFAHAHKLKSGWLGLGMIYLHTTDIRREEESGEEQGQFENKELSFNLSYSKLLEKNLYLGGSIKYLHDRLEKYIAKSIALDLGVLCKNFLIDNLNIACVLQNLGPALKHYQEKSPLPLDIKLATAYKKHLFPNSLLFKGTLTSACDFIIKPIERDTELNLGFEYNFVDCLKLRLGLENIFDKKKASGNISCGIGIRIFNYEIDYAYLPWQHFGNVHRFSARVIFKKPQIVEKVIEKVKVIEKIIEVPKKVVEEKPKVVEKPKVIEEKLPEIPKPPVIKEKPPLEEILSLSCYAYPEVFSPEEGITFYIKTKAIYDIKDWQLKIKTKEERKLVKVFKAKGLPPEEIIWYGKDDKGNLLPVGTYLYTCEVIDIKGNKLQTPASELVIKKIEKLIEIIEKEEGIFITLVGEVLFDKGSAELKPQAYSVLKEAASIIKKNLDKKVRIEGHTCNLPLIGKIKEIYKDNFGLSQARASAVKHYFIEKEGIPETILEAVGYGDTRPIASNATEEGRRKNRRVEIIIIK
jgi:flagellar motor protein MotB